MYCDRRYGFHFSNKISDVTILLASAFPRYNGLTVAFDVFTVTITAKFDYCGFQGCFCDLHLFVVCFNRSDCFPRECQMFFHLCSVCYGSTWSVTLWSMQDRDSQYVSRIEDTAGRVLGFLKVSIATNGRFSPCIPTCLSIPHSDWCSDDDTTHLPLTYFPQDPGYHPKCPLPFSAAARDVMERA